MSSQNMSSFEFEEDSPQVHRYTGRRKFLHVILFLFLLGNDLFDLVSDWFFFGSVVNVEKGLVYGPPEPAAVKWLLLVFSIVGLFTFPFECVNLWWEFFRDNPWLNADWLSLFVVWFEDIPQVVISLYLALSREEPISIFQLFKAGVIFVSMAIRIIITSVKYCNKKAVKSKHHVKLKVVIMVGILLEALGAGAIFFFTHTEKMSNGCLAFREPSAVFHETINEKQYFVNVSVFLSIATLFNDGALDNDKTDSIANWMRLSTLNHIRSGERDETTFRIQYENQEPGVFKLAVHEKMGNDSSQAAYWTIPECYTIDQNTAQITAVPNTTCRQPGYFTNSKSYYFKFHYQAPGSPFFNKKILGDINFNMALQQNGQCDPENKYTDTVDSSIKNNIPIILRYFRTNETFPPTEVRHLLQTTSGTPRFYRNDMLDLIDIFTVWKTGWLKSDSTGNPSPNLDTGLKVKCV